MNTILIYIFETFINIVEAGLFFYLISKKLESKERYRDNLKAIIVIGTVALTLIIILVNEIKINGMWGVLIFLIIQLIFIFMIMEADEAEKILWSGIYTTVDLSADVLAFFLSSFITSKPANVLMYEYPYRIITITVYAILLALYVYILCKIKKKKITIPKWSLYVFTTAIVLGVIMVQSMFEACIRYSNIISAGMMYGIYTVMTMILMLIAISIMIFTGFGGAYKKSITLAQENEKKAEQYKEELEKKVCRIITQNEKKFNFRINGSTYQVDLEKIKYIMSDLRTIKITMEDNQKYVFYGILDEVFEKIKENYPAFKRVNKSYVVNMNFVDQIKTKALIIGGFEITISRKYYSDFKNII